jgi:hypothetical protein
LTARRTPTLTPPVRCSTWRTFTATSSALSLLPARQSRRWPAAAPPAEWPPAAPTASAPPPPSTDPMASRWTARAASTSQTRTTT